MSETSERSGLRVDEHLRAFVEDELLAQVELTGEQFWSILARLQERFTPRIATALAERSNTSWPCSLHLLVRLVCCLKQALCPSKHKRLP